MGNFALYFHVPLMADKTNITQQLLKARGLNAVLISSKATSSSHIIFHGADCV